VPKHRIDARHEFPTLVVVTAEMPTNNFVGYAKKTLVRTIGALDSRFLANSPDPLIAATWRIASSACLTAFEALRINILSSMKQRAEETNFGPGGSTLIHATLLENRQTDRCSHDRILHFASRQRRKRPREGPRDEVD